MTEVRQWRLVGNWFDVCSCTVPCPCTFAQPPTNNHCQGVLAWHIRDGRFGDVRLDGLNALTGPTTPPGARVQLHNAPGAEVGPGQVATWAVGTSERVAVPDFGFAWEWGGRSSKHFPFDWHGPDE
jgi:hypothetical protein